MPFTFSHPAIVLPLAHFPKRWTSLTGLVIGSLVPDFEYFLRMQVKSEYSHTIGGLFWFDLPLGLLLAFVFHNLVRDLLFENLPACFQKRFADYKQFRWNRYFRDHALVVILSILLGAGSHLLWDSFTHPAGYFVRVIPALTRTVDIMGLSVPVFKILQHVSTIIGGLIVLIAVFRLPKHKVTPVKATLRYWIIFMGITWSVVAAKILFGLKFRQYGNLIVTVIAAALASLVVTPILMKIGKRRQSRCRS